MCLALPAKIESIDAAADTAVVRLGGVGKQVSLALLEGLQVGDYVLIHVGFALSRLSEPEALRTLALFAEAGVYPDGNTEV